MKSFDQQLALLLYGFSVIILILGLIPSIIGAWTPLTSTAPWNTPVLIFVFTLLPASIIFLFAFGLLPKKKLLIHFDAKALFLRLILWPKVTQPCFHRPIPLDRPASQSMPPPLSTRPLMRLPHFCACALSHGTR